jgi:hypothetical protein
LLVWYLARYLISTPNIHLAEIIEKKIKTCFIESSNQASSWIEKRQSFVSTQTVLRKEK